MPRPWPHRPTTHATHTKLVPRRYVAALAAEGLLPRRCVVFTDPDWSGRMFRTLLDDVLGAAAAASVAAAAASAGGSAASAETVVEAEASASAGSAGPGPGSARSASAGLVAGPSAGEGGAPRTLRPRLGRAQLAASPAPTPPPPAAQQATPEPPQQQVDTPTLRHAFLRVELGVSAEDSRWGGRAGRAPHTW